MNPPTAHDPNAKRTDPIWPTTLAMGLLFASGVGLVISLTHATAPSVEPVPWYANHWIWVGTLTALMALLAGVLAKTRNRLGPRMQTSLVVSLILHVLLAIYLGEQLLEFVLESPDPTDVAEVEPMPQLPQYYMPAPGESQPTQAFESMLASQRPSESTAEMARQMQQQQIETQPTASRLEQMPTLEMTQRTLERRPLPAPRLADNLSRLSRSEIAEAEQQPREVRSPRQRVRRQSISTADASAQATPSRQSNPMMAVRRPQRSAQQRDMAAQRTAASLAAASRPERPEAASEAMRPARRTMEIAAARAESIQSPRSPSTNQTASANRSTSPADMAARQATLPRRESQPSVSRRATATRLTPTEANVPRSAAAPRVSGRRQLSRDRAAEVATRSPNSATSNARISDVAAADVEPAPSRLAQRAETSPQSSPTQLRRNSTQGRPAMRASRTSNGAAGNTAMTQGVIGDASSPRARQSSRTASSNAVTTSSSPQRQLGEATAHELAAEVIDGPAASPSNSGPRQLANRAAAGNASALQRQRGVSGPSSRRAGGSANGNESRQDASALVANSGGASARRQNRRGRGAGSNEDAGQAANVGSRPARGQGAGLAALAQTTADDPGGDGSSGDSDGQQQGSESDGGAGAATGRIAGGRSGGRGVQRRTASVPVRTSAPLGRGGLGLELASVSGVRDRRARSRSENLQPSLGRFLQPTSSRPATISAARSAAAPFARRAERRRELQREGGPSGRTEATIELGLQYLASVQRPDGRWSLQSTGTTAEPAAKIVSDTAATGMALLAFLGAGYDHFEGQYQEEVLRGLTFLTQNQNANGDLYLRQQGPANQGIWLYSHGVAAIALCEAYGMTADPKLKSAAQRALDFIASAQHSRYGGWRYSPGNMADLSVSGWQLMALRSGQLAGLEVSKETIARVRRLLRSAQMDRDDGSPQFSYNPWSNDAQQRQVDRSPNTVMTSVGLLMRLYSGSSRENESIRLGADLLTDRLPTVDRPPSRRSMANPNRDAYYWYNATQVMYHMQGETWENWRDTLYPMLSDAQRADGPLAGSWDPFQPVPDRWAYHAGRIYLTSMNLLSLEIYYRHLPLYEDGLGASD